MLSKERISFPVRQFSKEFFPAQRADVAQKIREKRAAYFARKSTLSIKAGVVQEELSSAEPKLTALRQQTANPTEILQKIPLYQSLTHWRVQRLESTSFELTQQLGILQVGLQSKAELEDAKSLLDSFYTTQEQEFTRRDVAAVAKEYNVVFLHGILQDKTPNPNSLVKENADWETKLKIALSLQPTVTVSTVREGDTDKEMWARLGLILSGGVIVAASPKDGESRARTLRQRNPQLYDRSKDISEAIRVAIFDRDQSEERRRSVFYDYNELTIAHPQVAGFYLAQDRSWDRRYQTIIVVRDLPPLSTIIPIIQALGLPLYLVKGGIVYHANYDGRTKRVGRGKRVSINELTETHYQLPNPQREAITEEFLQNPPFKTIFSERPSATGFGLIFGDAGGNPENRIGYPDSLLVVSRHAGKKVYVELNAWNETAEFPDDFLEIDENTIKEFQFDAPPVGVGGRIKRIARIEGPDYIDEYVAAHVWGERNVYHRWINQEHFHSAPGEKSSWFRVHPVNYFERDRGWKGKNYIEFDIGAHHRHCIYKPLEEIVTTDDYLREAEQALRNQAEAIPRFESALGTPTPEEGPLYMKRLAFHLYGFGEQASQWQDFSAQQRAFALGAQVVPYAEYQQVVSRRTGPNGKFRLMKEDLQV